MDKKSNDILLKNVTLLSKLTEQEVSMMPATEAPLPSVEMVKQKEHHLPRLFQPTPARRDAALV